MTNKLLDNHDRAIRSEVRNMASDSARIAFKPPKAQLEYYVKLRDFSASGLGFLVRKDSDLLKHIRTGDMLFIKYYKENVSAEPLYLKVQIKHISAPFNGKPENHLVVGLSFLEK